MKRCPICKLELKNGQLVHLDFVYTITHQSCTTNTIIKDSGKFEDIINKYFLVSHNY